MEDAHDFPPERQEKILNDKFADLKFINIHFLDLVKPDEIFKFLNSEFLQMIL